MAGSGLALTGWEGGAAAADGIVGPCAPSTDGRPASAATGLPGVSPSISARTLCVAARSFSDIRSSPAASQASRVGPCCTSSAAFSGLRRAQASATSAVILGRREPDADLAALPMDSPMPCKASAMNSMAMALVSSVSRPCATCPVNSPADPPRPCATMSAARGNAARETRDMPSVATDMRGLSLCENPAVRPSKTPTAMPCLAADVAAFIRVCGSTVAAYSAAGSAVLTPASWNACRYSLVKSCRPLIRPSPAMLPPTVPAPGATSEPSAAPPSMTADCGTICGALSAAVTSAAPGLSTALPKL